VLDSWKDTATTEAIRTYVEQLAAELPPEERVAVFDNDGTLWCEKPMPVELGFILRKLAAAAEREEGLRGHQPWKAAYEKDYSWLSGVIVTGAETVLETARAEGWTVVSVRNDWTTVFAETRPAAGRVPTATVGDGDSSTSRRGKGVR
jgi:hypothetical protein